MNLSKLKIKFKNNKHSSSIYAFLKKIYFFFQKIFIFIIGIVFRFIPIKNNKIVVVNYNGKGYGDNNKYIVEELLKTGNHYEIVWLISGTKSKNEIPEQIKCVKNETIKALYELSTAKIWIDNTIKRFKPKKRKGQVYIQTWHAGLGMKKVGIDVKNCDSTYLNQTKEDAKITDFVISNSDYRSKSYINDFGYKCEIIKNGLPRNDILINSCNDELLKENIKKRLNISNEYKILLYAPTFRRNSTIEVYDINLINVKKALENKYGGKWVVLLRLHPHISMFSSDLKNNGDFIDVTNYSDLSELLLITDFLISDYSSLIFDFSLTRRPALMYAPDLNEYIEQKQLAVMPEDLPYEISKNNLELNEQIENFDENKYIKNLEEYFTKNGLVESGNSSKIICDKIFEIVRK